MSSISDFEFHDMEMIAPYTLSQLQRKRIILEQAIHSDNPAVEQALLNVLIVTKLADNGGIAQQIEFYEEESWVILPDNANTHDLVTCVYNSDNKNAKAALENFIDVARNEKF